MLDATLRASVDGLGEDLPVVRASGGERIHAPHSLGLVLPLGGAGRRSRAPTSLDDLIGRRVELEIAMPSGGPRLIAGVVAAAEEDWTGLSLEVDPKLGALTQTNDHRVFLARDAAQIAREVWGEHGVALEARLVRELPRPAQTVQCFESDFDFVARVLADQGVALVADTTRADTVRLVDHPDGYDAIEGESALPFAPDAGLVERECVWDLHLSHSLAIDRVQLRDYDFERPRVDQDVTASVGAGSRTLYAHAAGYRDPALGRTLAALRLEEGRSRQVLLKGRASSLRLQAGRRFRITGAPRDDLDREWLVIEARFDVRDHGAEHAADGRRLRLEFVAVPADVPFRPTRRAAPKLGGVQTATITGPTGVEIHTEAHARSTALLRWDRRGKVDQSSSHWMRTLQPQTTGGVFLPRVGWEALVGFEGQSGDAPYVLGRLDNGTAPPAEPLPAQKVRGAFGSRTTPGGGSTNVVRMDDAAGQEGFLMGASAEYVERTERDKTVDVAADDSLTVGASRTQIVGKVHEVGVTGAQTYSVAASRSLDVASSMAVEAGTESVMVGGVRSFDVGGDYSTEVKGALSRLVAGAKVEAAVEAHNRHVTGAGTHLVGGTWNELSYSSSVSVGGTHVRAISGAMAIRAPKCSISAAVLKESFGPHTINAGAAVVFQFSSAATVSFGAASTLHGGGMVAVVASSDLTIDAGGTTIKITPSAITIDGPFDGGVPAEVTGTEETT